MFLSTLPARGATVAVPRNRAMGMQFLSTLPARGATRQLEQAGIDLLVSIHAPREGSDVPHVVYGFI